MNALAVIKSWSIWMKALAGSLSLIVVSIGIVVVGGFAWPVVGFLFTALNFPGVIISLLFGGSVHDTFSPSILLINGLVYFGLIYAGIKSSKRNDKRRLDESKSQERIS